MGYISKRNECGRTMKVTIYFIKPFIRRTFIGVLSIIENKDSIGLGFKENAPRLYPKEVIRKMKVKKDA